MQHKILKNVIIDNKIKTKAKQLLSHKIKKSKTNKELIEFKKIYILGPTINIANKQCYILEPLKTDLSRMAQKRNFDKLNCITDRTNNDEEIYKKQKIKVRLNSIKNQNKINFSLEKKNNNEIDEKKIITPINKKQRTLTFNYSDIDNKIIYQNNKNTINCNSNINILNSIQNNFNSSTENLLNNGINERYLNYFKPNEKSFKFLPNKFKDISDINNKRISRYFYNKKKNFFFQINNYSKDKDNQDISNMELNKINNLKIKDINNIDNQEKERYGNKSCLTERQCLMNKNSLKTNSHDKNIIPKLKLLRNNNRNNDLNSILSPRYNNFRNTYKKKLIKMKYVKIDKKNINKNDSKSTKPESDEKNNFEQFKNDNILNLKYMCKHHNLTKNISQNNISSNDLSISGIFNIQREKEKIINHTLLNNKSNINLSNKILQDNNSNYNKMEKDDTTYKTDQKTRTDKNNSTSNSFYNNQNNTNLVSLNNKFAMPNKLKHKLKNLITSIDCINGNKDNSKLKFNKTLKNIILYEVDQKGKINCKVKEMKNSVEKVVRDNSEIKKRSKIIDYSPKVHNNKILSLYVKKNQGTILRKLKNKNKIEFYCPYSNKTFQE